jgi:peptidoglycan/xylan/chitin deacetylase (PgdA/CDA1 family)
MRAPKAIPAPGTGIARRAPRFAIIRRVPDDALRRAAARARDALEALLRHVPAPSAVHRRRQAAALGALAVLALAAGLSAGSGGGSTARAKRVPAVGYFARLRILGGGGSHSLTLEQRALEDRAIDRALATTPYVRFGSTARREIALTFDDGPGPYTQQVLDVLARERVPATFFVVGQELEPFGAGTAAEIAAGYPIGDHTQNHRSMSALALRDQRDQILEQASGIGNYGAPYPRLFRPPYGVWDATTLRLLRQFRMLMVLWSIDSDDYRQPGVQAIVANILGHARPGAIVLMHDAGGNRSETVAALPLVIDGLRKRGYRLVTVPRLMLDDPPQADQQLPPGYLTTTGAG